MKGTREDTLNILDQGASLNTTLFNAMQHIGVPFNQNIQAAGNMFFYLYP